MGGTSTGTPSASGLGAATFTRTSQQIIEAAYRQLKVHGAEQQIKGWKLTDGLEWLNLVIRNWPNPQFSVWNNTRDTLTLTAKNEFLLVSSGGDMNVDTPLDILTATLMDTDNNETVLIPMSQKEFDEIADKTETGDPTKYYYEIQTDGGHLFLDFVVDDTTDVIELTFKAPVDSITSLNTNIDMLSHWLLPTIYNLGEVMAPSFDVTLDAAFVDMTNKSESRAESFDTVKEIEKKSQVI